MQSPRTKKTELAYEKFKSQKTAPERDLFNLDDEKILREYKYWVIIESRFPYDTMVRVNDLLILRRPITRHRDLTAEEQSEYEKIMDELSDEHYYDATIENFPQTKSVKQQIHIHLVCWHNSSSKI